MDSGMLIGITPINMLLLRVLCLPNSLAIASCLSLPPPNMAMNSCHCHCAVAEILVYNKIYGNPLGI